MQQKINLSVTMSRTAPNVETEREKKTRYVCHYRDLDTTEQPNEALYMLFNQKIRLR